MTSLPNHSATSAPDGDDPAPAEDGQDGATPAVETEDPAEAQESAETPESAGAPDPSGAGSGEGAPSEEQGAEEQGAEEQGAEEQGAEEQEPEGEAAKPELITPIMEGNLPSTHRSDIAESEKDAGPKKAKKKTAKKKASKKKVAKKATKKLAASPGKLVRRTQPARQPTPEELEPKEELGVEWYVVRVQSGRENSVRKALERKVRELNLGPKDDENPDAKDLVHRVLVPTKPEIEVGKDGKRREVEKKLYPGYVMVNLLRNELTEQTVRRISGVGDFVSPHPMSEREVEEMLRNLVTEEEGGGKKPEINIALELGQKVTVKEGPFENFDGLIKEINPDKGMVKVVCEIFGRQTPIDIEYWKVEPV